MKSGSSRVLIMRFESPTWSRLPDKKAEIASLLYLADEYDGPLQEPPQVPLVPHPVVHGGVASVENPARDQGREDVADGQAEQPDDHLVNLRERVDSSSLA